MAIRDTRASSGLSALVERRIHDWQRLQQRSKTEPVGEPPPETVKFYVAISRECGCDADALADAIAAQTGFQKFDYQILDYMAKDDHVRRRLYETLDDRTMRWIETICSSLTMGPAVDQVEYFNRLSHAILAICRNTHAIIIGRAANFILPADQGLAVRLVAPQNVRLERYAQRLGVDLKTALREMERIDHGRGQFIETHFGRFAFDPRRYDMVFNVSQFTHEQIVSLIMTALTSKAGPSLKLPVKTPAG